MLPYQAPTLPRRGALAQPADPADCGVCDAQAYGLRGDGTGNDQPALAALVDALGAGYARDGRPRVIFCGPGVYPIRDAGTVWRSGVSLIGAGRGVTRFVLDNSGNRADPVPLAHFTVVQHGAGPDNHLVDCTFAHFEIDGSQVALAEYHYLAKGLAMQYVLRGTFRDLYIHHTAATGLGCDFLQDSLVENVVAVGCGRLDNGQQLGGAGIGIGLGGWGDSERLTITGCTAIGNGTHGIFVELQQDYRTPPRGVRITACHAEGNRFGICDWGADGLIVSACTMIDNLEAGFDVSARGAAGVAGRGGALSDCVIDGNVRDGIIIGNTPGPYVVRGNRISGNGGYGYRQDDLARGYRGPAGEIVVEDNDIWGNGLDGVHLGAALTDATLVGNRIRNNGVRRARSASGGGEAVTYTRRTLIDRTAGWVPGGHRGKVVRVGGHTALVLTNTATELTLAPVRPDGDTAWSGATPTAGTPYELPDTPTLRAGLTVDAAVDGMTIRGNRCWDNQSEPTQTHGLRITDRGSCVDCRIEDNDLMGNGVASVRTDTPPIGGLWERNHGSGYVG